MTTQYELNIRLQMEALITEREGMIAENKQREHLGQSMAHGEDKFISIAGQFTYLLGEFRKYG